MSGLTVPALALRDVHLPPLPGWWPLATGWWIVMGGLMLVAVLVAGRWLQRQRRRRRWQIEFDQRLQEAGSSLAQLVLMAEMLRRAALAVDPDAAGLQGEAWLLWLDDGCDGGFVRGAGRLLHDGAYRPAVAPDQVDALRPLVRATWTRLRLAAAQ